MSGPILRALDALNDRLVLADAIGQSFELAGCDTALPWVHVYRDQVEAIRQASEALEILLRGGGDGGYCPHGDKVPAAQSTSSRDGFGCVNGADSRPEKLS